MVSEGWHADRPGESARFFFGLWALPDDLRCLAREDGGAERNRTAGLLIANEALSQLSYSPKPEARVLGTGALAVKLP